MLTNIKALLVVLCIVLPTFALCKRVCLQYMTEEAFKRRRFVWLTLTIVAFLSPTFWIYALVALFVTIAALNQEDNPLALYALITFVIPSIRVDVPVPVVKQLFDLSQYRMLSLLICVPVTLKLLRGDPALRRLRAADVFLILFLILQVVLLMPYEATTATMRRSFLFTVDTFVVFYAFSRLRDREQIADVMACFWLSCALMAPMAVFETARSWLLYTNMASLWGDPNELAWLLRAGTLRAQVSANHSINLGYHLAVALGFYLYLRTRVTSRMVDLLVLAFFAAGIYVTQSRGAWLAAGLIVAFYLALRPGAARKMPQAIMLTAVVIGIMYVTPLKESVLDRLPFIGSADQDTVEYRQQLAEVSWSLIQIHPFFGDPFVFLRMESLKQGQGIIDIINAYLMTALFNGLVGLVLMVMTFLIATLKGCAAVFRARDFDPEGSLLGASLAACLIGTLIFIATAAYGATTYILAGLLISYAATVGRLYVVEQESPYGQGVRGLPA